MGSSAEAMAALKSEAKRLRLLRGEVGGVQERLVSLEGTTTALELLEHRMDATEKALAQSRVSANHTSEVQGVADKLEALSDAAVVQREVLPRTISQCVRCTLYVGV